MAPWLLAAVFLFAPGISRAETANLLANGGFEHGSGEDMPGWKTSVPHESALVRTDAASPHEGTRCGALQTTSDLVALLVSDPPVPVAPGENLSFRVWCRIEDLSTSSGGSLNCSIGFADARGRTLDHVRTELSPSAAGEWTAVENRVTVPARAASASVYLGVQNMTGRTWWDDAELKAASAQVVRLAPEAGSHGPDQTTVPVVVINRDPAARGRELLVRVRPGSSRLRHLLDGEALTTLTAEVPLNRRSKVNIMAELYNDADRASLFVTSQSVTVWPLLEVEPPLPTHFVREEGIPRFEQRVEVHESRGSRRSLSLRCVVRDSSGKAVAQRITYPLPPNPVTVHLELPPSLAGKPADYAAEVHLLRGTDVLTSSSQGWHVITRDQSHVTLGADGNLTVEGKPFFPLGLYMAGSYPELKEAGFNVVQHYHPFAVVPGGEAKNQEVRRFLDKAHAAGLKALMFISHGPDRLNEAESLRRIRMFRNHPAVLVWYQEEAVDRGYKPLSYLQSLYDTTKRIAPEHPFVQGDRRDTAARMAGRADIFPEEVMDAGIWWWYPTPLRPTPNLGGYEGEPTGDELEYVPPVFLTQSGAKKPLWAALQSYRKPGPTDARFPTPAEYRAQAYIAICHGARGLLYYTGFGERRHGILHRKEEGHWEDLKKLVGELSEMSPVFMARDAGEMVVMKPKDALVSTRLKQVGDRRVLMAVNRSVRPVEVAFGVTGAKNGPIAVRYEDRNVTAENGEWKDCFDGYGVHIYDLP